MTDMLTPYEEALREKFRVLNRKYSRPESTGLRDLDMSRYVRTELRPADALLKVDGIDLGGFSVSDLDFVFNDYRNRTLRLLEVKTRNALLPTAQQRLWSLMDDMLHIGAMHMADYGLKPVRYGGLTVLRMWNGRGVLEPATTPSNSQYMKWMSRRFKYDYDRWDEELISEAECWRRLNAFDLLDLDLKAGAA